MLTPEDKQEIINTITEKVLLIVSEKINGFKEEVKQEVLLLIPDTIGNLMTEQATQSKMNAEFYKAHKEFQDHKDVVVSVIEMIEGKNIGMDYDKVLEKAVPEIKRRIETISKLDMQTVDSNPSRVFNDVIDIDSTSNGEI